MIQRHIDDETSFLLVFKSARMEEHPLFVDDVTNRFTDLVFRHSFVQLFMNAPFHYIPNRLLSIVYPPESMETIPIRQPQMTFGRYCKNLQKFKIDARLYTQIALGNPLSIPIIILVDMSEANHIRYAWNTLPRLKIIMCKRAIRTRTHGFHNLLKQRVRNQPLFLQVFKNIASHPHGLISLIFAIGHEIVSGEPQLHPVQNRFERLDVGIMVEYTARITITMIFVLIFERRHLTGFIHLTTLLMPMMIPTGVRAPSGKMFRPWSRRV